MIGVGKYAPVEPQSSKEGIALLHTMEEVEPLTEPREMSTTGRKSSQGGISKVVRRQSPGSQTIQGVPVGRGTSARCSPEHVTEAHSAGRKLFNGIDVSLCQPSVQENRAISVQDDDDITTQEVDQGNITHRHVSTQTLAMCGVQCQPLTVPTAECGVLCGDHLDAVGGATLDSNLDKAGSGGFTQKGTASTLPLASEESPSATVPYIRVRLLQSVKVLPYQSKSVLVKVDDRGTNPILVEYDAAVEEATGLQVEDAIVSPREGIAQLVVSNMSGFTQVVGEGEVLGKVTEVEELEPNDSSNATQEEMDSAVNMEPTDLLPETTQHEEPSRPDVLSAPLEPACVLVNLINSQSEQD